MRGKNKTNIEKLCAFLQKINEKENDSRINISGYSDACNDRKHTNSLGETKHKT